LSVHKSRQEEEYSAGVLKQILQHGVFAKQKKDMQDKSEKKIKRRTEGWLQ